jgi:hypothetical protein
MLVDRTIRRLAFATVRLIEEHKLLDPTAVEITCEAWNEDLPVSKPWVAPEGSSIPPELFQGTQARMQKIRWVLQDEHNILTTPISVSYYQAGLRNHQPRDLGQIEGSIPAAHFKTCGIRVVRPDEEDPFFLAYLAGVGQRGVSTVANATTRANKALEIGGMAPERARKLLDHWEARLGNAGMLTGKRPAALA